MNIPAPENLLASNRLIHKRQSTREVPDLIQTAFAAELLAPSPVIWIVSAWTRNIPIFDNSSGGFRHLNPSWPFGPVRLADVLTEFLSLGTTIHLAVRPRDNASFLQVLYDRCGYEGEPSPSCPLYVHEVGEETLHQKGILTSRFYLRGSMNLTKNGIEVFDEQLEFTTAPDALASTVVEFKDRWGD